MAKAADQTITLDLCLRSGAPGCKRLRLFIEVRGDGPCAVVGEGPDPMAGGELREAGSGMRTPAKAPLKVWQQPEGGPYVQLRGPLSQSRVHRTVWANRPRLLVVRPGERVTRPAPLSDFMPVRSDRSDAGRHCGIATCRTTEQRRKRAPRTSLQRTPPPEKN